MLDARKDHSRDPEEDDVVCGHEQRVGVKIIQIRRFIGKTERRKGPKRAAEPSIEHVFVLLQNRMSALEALFRSALGDLHMPAFFAVVSGNAMSPPKLTGNAPILDVFHPIKVDFGKTIGDKFGFFLAHGLNCGFGERLHLDEPLLGNDRLDRAVAAIAMPDVVSIILYLDHEAARLQVGDDDLACPFARKPAILLARVFVERAVVVHDTYDGQIVPQPHFEVVGIVGGRDLDRAASEICFHIFVGNYGYEPPYER